LSAGAEVGGFRTKGKKEAATSSKREKEAAGNTNQAVEQTKHKLYSLSV